MIANNPEYVNLVCLPYENPETAMYRLEAIYGAVEECALVYIDLKDSEGNIIPTLCGVDDSEEKLRLIPLAKWLTASDVEGKGYEVWNAQSASWTPITETQLTKEAWHALRFS